MEPTTPKIELYVTRTFSEKLGDTLSFLRENWRVLLKYFTYTMLPASLVLGFFLNHFWGGYMSLLNNIDNDFTPEILVDFMLNTGATIIVGLLAYAVFMAMIFALIRLYSARPMRLQGLTNEEFVPEFRGCLKRAAIYLLVIALLGVLLMVLMSFLMVGSFALNPVFGLLVMLLFYAALVAVIIPLSLSQPIYMLEDIGIFGALSKAFRLGFATWGGIFAISFIIGLLTNVLQSFTMAPWYILYMIKFVFTVSNDLDDSFVNSIGYTLMEYLACVLQCIGYMLAAVITTVAITIQYGHASDKIDGVGVARSIDRFDEFDNF